MSITMATDTSFGAPSMAVNPPRKYTAMNNGVPTSSGTKYCIE